MQYISIERQLDSYGQSARARGGQPGHGRLAAFAAAAGAGLAMTGAADASIVYTAVNTVLSNSQPDSAGAAAGSDLQFKNIDFNGDGNVDFQASLFWYKQSTASSAHTTAQADLKQIRQDGGLVLNGSTNLAALTFGSAVNPTATFNRWFALRDKLVFRSSSSSGTSYRGTWAKGVPAFAGVSFKLGGNSYLGWIRLSWNDLLGTGGTPGADGFPDQLTLVDYAWNDTPGGAINAGDGIPTEQVPVPAPLALLAIGAAGIAATRRRRAPVARA